MNPPDHRSTDQCLREARQELINRLKDWEGAGGQAECVMDAIEGLISAKFHDADLSRQALVNLLKAVDGVLFFTWEDDVDLDHDAVEAIKSLRRASKDYDTVRRVSRG